MKPQWLIVLAVLLLTGCDDSKHPLSDPQTSKPDDGLVGVWRGDKVYDHIGHAGKKFPKGMIRFVEVTHDQAGVESPREYLAFSTVLAGKTYLNFVLDQKQVKLLDEKGWNAEVVEAYTFVKYQLDGDKLVLWLIDEKAKKQAIKDGKIKGVIEKNQPAKFTDTTENVARFIAEAGDSLWNTKEPGRLERVTDPPKIGKQPTPPLRPLGSNLMVDKNGIIWDGDHPVGIWGVNGGGEMLRQ